LSAGLVAAVVVAVVTPLLAVWLYVELDVWRRGRRIRRRSSRVHDVDLTGRRRRP
jgi:hypothetical protein